MNAAASAIRAEAAARVALVVRPAAGGIRRHVSLLAAGLDTTRFSPLLYAPADFTLESPAPDVPHQAVNIAAQTRLIADLRAIGHLSGMLRSGQAGLVHAHGLRAALIGVPAAKRAGVPSLFTAHNLLPPLGMLQRVLLRQIGRATGSIVAVSQAVADTLVAAGLPASKIHVVPNGIPLGQYRLPPPADWNAAYGIPDDKALVLAVGRLSPEKGFDVLLDAFPGVLQRVGNAYLIFAGDGPEAANLRARAQNSTAAAHIRFLGRVADVVPLLHRAQIVAIPSRQEGQGIVALEAMAAGPPVVASAVGGLQETVVDGVTGRLVPPDDSRALADALAGLLQDAAQESLAAMREQAHRRVEQLYSVERMIQNTQAIYQSLLP